MDDWSTYLERDEGDPLRDVVALWTAEDPEELWQALTVHRFPSSTHPWDAVGLFRRHHENGAPGAVTTALLLCTDPRWERCTARLIAGLVDTTILAEEDLAELAATFLWSDHFHFQYPVRWIGTDWVGVDLDDGSGAVGSSVWRLDPSTLVPVERRIPPPLRRWAAAMTLRSDPSVFDAMRVRAQELGSLDGAGVVSGMLDAIEALDDGIARQAIGLGLGWPRALVRLLALDLLADVDPEAARRRAAADPDKKVRAWTAPRARRNLSSGPAHRLPRKGRRDHRDLRAGQVELFPESCAGRGTEP